ncbi:MULTISPECIES: DEAD/DEAH box helicase [Pyrococcus]|nr:MULTISPECIES: DEAD/DEAH box helicase [Pyrococcus]MDK2869954.1 ATP-dependent helicase Lhr and Lhr-like helicase [Pyrococcus sp.]
MHILIKKAIKERFGKLNALQQLAFHKIRGEGKSVLIIAPTGSGKTEAAVIPILDAILRENLKPIAAIYIAPLKALNRDLLERLKWWEEKTGVIIEVRHGDTPTSKRLKQVKNPPHLLITTPEMLPAILTTKSFRPYLKNTKFIVIDEIGELIENKRGTQLILNLKRLELITEDKPIRIGLSATIGSEEKVRLWMEADEVVKPRLKKKYKFTVLYPQPIPEDEKLAEELKVPIEVATRLRVVWDIVEKHKKVLIFVNTRQFAEILGHRLKAWGKPVEVHHGSLSREARIEAEKKLKEGKIKALICTSSMELGIDIGDVDAVIQYMSPRQVNRLVQRAGRSKHRLWETSEAYIITTNVEDYLQSLAIAKLALEGKLEDVNPYENALDVLAHFIVGLTIEYRNVNITEPYSLAKSTYPYRKLSWEDYQKVLEILEEARIIRRDGDAIKLGKNAFKYYFENLSTIPDEISYAVIDIASGKSVGRLDENFVTELEESMEFIMHGRSWIVLEINEKERIIKVKESNNLESALPSWEGELIPVPLEVAEFVGKLKRELLWDKERALKLLEGVEFNKEELEVAISQLVESEPVASDRDIIIESYPKFVIIHADFGNKINEGLTRFISVFLSARYGNIFLPRSQAHGIIIRSPFRLNPEEIKEILLMKAEVGDIVARGIRDTPIYRWKMSAIAKRFGALRRDARIKKVERLFEGTIIEKETFNEIYHDKIDIDKTEKILEKIRKGEIRMKTLFREEITPLSSSLATLGGEFLIRDILTQEEVEEIFREKLLDAELVMVCTNCGFSWRTKVRRVMDRVNELSCPKCDSKMIAPLHPKDSETFISALKKLKRGEKLSREEEKYYLRGLKAADLLKAYGKDALLALATYGVGVESATRILRDYRGKSLIKALIEAEKHYIQTRKFWE